MKRALPLLGLLTVLGLFVAPAFGQATSVKLCDKDATSRCVSLSSADGGPPAVTAFALPTSETGVRLDQSVQRTFTNCAATGSAVQVIPDGKYYMFVTGEATTLCIDQVCDGGNGTTFPTGFTMYQRFATTDGGPGVNAACLSAGGAGDFSFTKTHR